MHIGMRLPGIDQDRRSIIQEGEAVPDGKPGVGAFDLQQHVAMRVRMAHQLPIHIEKGDPAELALGHP